MNKRVYISADYDFDSGDRNVVEILNKWACDELHSISFVDMAKVASGSVSKNPDCRICDLKDEFNRQINASSVVIFVVGDKTKDRTSGSTCKRMTTSYLSCSCTPYKQNVNGLKMCKYASTRSVGENEDVGMINSYSYLRHEFEQADKKKKRIIIVYNSKNKQETWLPNYMLKYANLAFPFWTENAWGARVGNYQLIKNLLENA